MKPEYPRCKIGDGDGDRADFAGSMHLSSRARHSPQQTDSVLHLLEITTALIPALTIADCHHPQA
jgi:hypothetical protein